MKLTAPALSELLFEIELEGREQSSWSLGDFEGELNQESSVVFLWPNDDHEFSEHAAVQGFVLFRVVVNELWIMNLAVRQKGQGQGQLMMQAFDDHVRETFPDLTQWGLEVREANVAAQNIYKRLGFEQVAVRKSYYKDGENAVVMIKPR